MTKNKNKILIIAEAGVNHNGSYSLACKIIDKAAEAGADIIKFQTFKASTIAIKDSQKANYQKKTGNINETQYEMLKELELDFQKQKKLFKYCKIKKIEFLSSGFDHESLFFLNNLNLKKFKIPSGEITNLPYLRIIGGFNKEVIISSGMSNLKEIRKAINILVISGTSKRKITVLHCTTSYPTHEREVNLKAMNTIANKLKIKTGYSDHTLGIEIPIAAAALGAKIIEKHITLNKKMKGPDHLTSLNPIEFKLMVSSIRKIEKSLGDGKKNITNSERKNIINIRKSIYASKIIKKGEKFTIDNIIAKRPAKGKSPMLWDQIIKGIAKKNYYPDDLI